MFAKTNSHPGVNLWIMSLLTREHMIDERRNEDFRCVVYGLGEIYLTYLHTLSTSRFSRWLSLHRHSKLFLNLANNITSKLSGLIYCSIWKHLDVEKDKR